MPSMIFVNLPVADLAAATRQGLSRALFPVASRLTSMAWTFRAGWPILCPLRHVVSPLASVADLAING